MNREERRLRKIKRTFGRKLCPACDVYYDSDNLWHNDCQCIVDFKIHNRNGISCESVDLKDISEGVVIIYEESR